MIGLDTNVLVRYLTQDEPTQSARATRLIEQELSESDPGFVGLVVLAELYWVLKRLYGATPGELRELLTDLLETAQLVIESRDAVRAALERWAAQGGDFPDALIAASAEAAGCARVVSFDRGAARAGMEALS